MICQRCILRDRLPVDCSPDTVPSEIKICSVSSVIVHLTIFALFHVLSVYVEVNNHEKDIDEDQDTQFESNVLQDASATGRLTTEFQIIDIIGKGGFGEVLKV